MADDAAEMDLRVGASWTMRVLIVLMGAAFLMEGDWVLGASSAVALLLALVPTVLEQDHGVTTPPLIDFLVTLFLFLHIGGLYTQVYVYVPNYDLVLHAATSGLVALIGLLLAYTVDRYVEGIYIVSYRSLAIFIFLFTVAVGALWEIGEFASDMALGTRNQGDNHDTMRDLVSDAVAGLIVAVLGTLAAGRGLLEDMAEDVGPGLAQMAGLPTEERRPARDADREPD